MRLAERSSSPPATELLELVTPRTNLAAIGAAENLLAAISLAEPFALEIAATDRRRRFLARAGSPAMRDHLADQLGVAYPQADLRPVPADEDPLRRGREVAAACALRLRAAPYLPLRTFADRDLDDPRAAQADPVLGVLGALGGLPEGWRVVSQLVLRPAPPDWCRDYLRLAVESPLARERVQAQHDTSLAQVWLTGGLLVAGVTALQAYRWYLDEQWLELGLLGAGAVAGLAGLLLLLRRLNRTEVHDPRLVREKLEGVAFLAQPRLALFAPADADPRLVAARLERTAGAYRQFDRAAGNGFEARGLDPRGRDLRVLAPLPGRRAGLVLTARELAGLWHPPRAADDAPLVERTAARALLPLPDAVATGCRIGLSSHQCRTVPVHLPDELLRRHLLLLAKTGRGKSSLLLRIAQHLMADRGRTLVLVDPHRDLARAALALVPADRRDDVVYLDAGDRGRAFGLNLIDAGLGWERDQAVESTLTVFQRQFDTFWGPRMANAFRWSLATLVDANVGLRALGKRARQRTVLDVVALLNEVPYRRLLAAASPDPFVPYWWGEYDQLTRQLQIDTANPVLSKVFRFAASQAARALVGQPVSTIDPAGWLRDARIVLVSTSKGTVGEDTAGLVGATLINLVGLLVANQADLPPRERRPVTLVVDEFQAMAGADYELVLAELAKYGGNLVLATQSLARLDALDRTHGRALKATLFANLDGLFAFHCSAEDARYAVRELGEAVDEADLGALGDHRCYVRMTARGRREPVFSVHLDPPPAADPALADELAARSAARYGRDREVVERELAGRLLEVATARRQAATAKPDADADGAAGGSGPATTGNDLVGRNEHRDDPERRAAEIRARALKRILALSGEEAGTDGPAAPAGEGPDGADPPAGSRSDGGDEDRDDCEAAEGAS